MVENKLNMQKPWQLAIAVPMFLRVSIGVVVEAQECDKRGGCWVGGCRIDAHRWWKNGGNAARGRIAQLNHAQIERQVQAGHSCQFIAGTVGTPKMDQGLQDPWTHGPLENLLRGQVSIWTA